MRKGDIWLVVVVLAVVAMIIIPKYWLFDQAAASDAKVATIKVDGRTMETVFLSGKERQIQIETPHSLNILEVKDGQIRMVKADCPDKVCIHSGPISEVYETIVCLPNRLIVEISDPAQQGVDIDAIVQ